VRSVLPWVAAYLAILLAWAVIILRRTGPTLWKGRSLVALNIAFVVVSTAVLLLEGRTPGEPQGGWAWRSFPPGFIALDLALIVIAVAVRKKWLLLRISHGDTIAILERCFTQTRATSVRRADGYAVPCGEAEMTVIIRPSLISLVSVRFTGGEESKRAALLRSLFGKQFHGSFPTPRFRA
jgi:hypothetical protein